MPTFVPDYYRDFKCIASMCRHSCCIGWEIDIDDKTYKAYGTEKGEFAKRLKENIAMCGETAHFVLGDDERCPFLNDENLCEIIINLGEDKLCHICSEHPRYINFYDTFGEKGIGLCCEEACRLVLTKKDKVMLVPLNENEEFILAEDEEDFISYRNALLRLLQDRSKPIEARAEEFLLKVGAEFPQKSFKEWKEIFSGLECLEPAWQAELCGLESGKEDNLGKEWDIYFEQLLVYFLLRHFSPCYFSGEYKERAAFCVLGYKIIKKLFSVRACEKGKASLSDLLEIVRSYSTEIEYSEENTQKLLEILEEELYS